MRRRARTDLVHLLHTHSRVVLSETVGVDVGAALLPYLVGFGAASVFYWWATDDLTVYAAVQAHEW